MVQKPVKYILCTWNFLNKPEMESTKSPCPEFRGNGTYQKKKTSISPKLSLNVYLSGKFQDGQFCLYSCKLTEVAGEVGPDLVPQKFLLSQKFRHLIS